MKLKAPIALALLVVLFLVSPDPVHAQDGGPVVRAVLFYSPTCPHCKYVITQTLPPISNTYGKQLQIAYVNVSEESGQKLFQATLGHFGLDHAGVPFLVMGDTYMIGSVDIPDRLPGMVESGLAAGGVDWPDIPALKSAISRAEAGSAPDTQSSSITQPPGEPTWKDLFARDPVGNSLAVIVLAAMLVAVIWAVLFFRRPGLKVWKPGPAWLIPALCAAGLLVAGYLAYVEATGSHAVCGPVGDCNAVQQSPYARLFGIFPIGQVGLVGYVAILAAWLLFRYRQGRVSDIAFLAIFLMAYFGTWFSIYLTFLEPFVIGATCAWCLTSAILMTVLMGISAGQAKAALARLAPPPARA